LFCLLVLFSVAFGQAGLSAWAGGLSLSMGQSKSGSGSAVGSGSTATGTTTQAAGSLTVNLDQFANLPGQGWQNGDLNGNNSAYGEGMVVPFRLAIEGLAAGQHTIHLNYDFLTGNPASEAYDFLATWNVSENPDKCADPNSGGASSQCPNNLGSADTHAFPGDSFSPAVSPGLTVNGAMAFANVSRNLTMYGGSIDSIGAVGHASGNGDMVVTFTTTTDWAFFLWGAHIAQSPYWNESNGGAANGAATISGAPWHMRTQNLDGSGAKNQDRSIQPSAIAAPTPNISVLKTADQGTINAGDTAAFTIVVTNDGPGAADNVTLNDPLPAGVAWSIDPAVAGCSISSGTLSCTFATLAEGESKTIHVSGVTDAADCGPLTNTATVAADNEGSDQSDNTSTATITVNCPSIHITKSPDQGTVSAGDPIGFTITVTNSGAGSASGVTVTDTLPTDPGLNWAIDAANSDAGCSITAGTLTCNFGSLAPGASKHVHITSSTTAATCGTVDNTASVTTSNDGSDSDDASITVDCPNVTVLKTADQGTIDAGDTAAFTILVTNEGPGTAHDVTLTDTLPTGIVWTEDSPDCSITAGVMSCDFGDLADGATRTVHVTGETDAADCGVLSNTAVVAASNEALVSIGDNLSNAKITVDCPVIALTKTPDQGTVSAGEDIGFTIEATNNGAGTAHGVTVTDTLPTDAGLAWTIDAANSDAGCTISSGVLTCNWGDLASGASKHVHITSPTTAATCGTVDNTASVTTSNDGSDSDGATVTVDCPNISVHKTADDTTVDAADQIGFTITVSNAGPGTATDVVLNDTLPTNGGLAWSIDGGTGAQFCDITNGVLTCDFGDMGSGASYTVHITSDTDHTTCGTVDNTATVTISNGDGDSDGASIDVNCPPIGIDIEKNGPDLAHVGDTITYTFAVQLTQDEPLGNVIVTDPNCNEGAPVYVSGDDGDNVLEPGEVWNYTCTHLVTATDPDPLPNTATVQGTSDDGRNATDSDDHTVDLIHPAIQIVKTVDPKSGNPGDTVTYTYVVTNTGDTTLYDISVDDDVIGHIGDIAELAPGDSVTLTKDFVLPSGNPEVTNVGTATGTDTLGEQVSDDDDAFVTIVKAENPPPPPPTAFTGSDAARLGLIAGVLVALGLLGLVLGRRRREA
jgi:uncharacterized repeat protein (TIGR01451 family)